MSENFTIEFPDKPITALPALNILHYSWSSALKSLSVAISEAYVKTPFDRPLLGDSNETTLEEELFDIRSEYKVRISEVAMHLNDNWRSGLFTQLDKLLDHEEWDEEDKIPTNSSFQTFLRTLLEIGPVRRPGLGASHRGNLIAAWTTGCGNRLTIECLNNDSLRWVVVVQDDGDRESAAGETTVKRIESVLAPYSPEQWFG